MLVQRPSSVEYSRTIRTLDPAAAERAAHEFSSAMASYREYEGQLALAESLRADDARRQAWWNGAYNRVANVVVYGELLAAIAAANML